jgi:hypothetical protein
VALDDGGHDLIAVAALLVGALHVHSLQQQQQQSATVICFVAALLVGALHVQTLRQQQQQRSGGTGDSSQQQ